MHPVVSEGQHKAIIIVSSCRPSCLAAANNDEKNPDRYVNAPGKKQ